MADSERPDAATTVGPPAWDPDSSEEPMRYEQASLAVSLCESLLLHRDANKLLWHVEVNEKVERRLADGNRRGVVPDLYVVVGLRQLPSGVYRPWVRGKSVDVVVEFSTHDSIEYDRGDKFAVYRDELRVAEYFVFDVDAVAIEGQLEGYRLEDGAYRPIASARTGAGDIRLPSRRLGLELGPIVNPVSGKVELRAFVLPSGEPLPNLADVIIRDERAARAAAETARAAAETARAAAEITRAAAETARAEVEATLEQYRRRFGPLPPP